MSLAFEVCMMRFVPLITSVLFVGVTACGADPELGTGAGGVTPDEQACGGLLGLACDPGDYCHFEPSELCGAADATGTCRAIPDVCAAVEDPVCGCDGVTYSNACHAAAAGVGLVSRSPCDDDSAPRACGGLLGLLCQEGEYCHYRIEDMCGAADATGTCRVVPDVCQLYLAPVCGCDGQTHGNACAAHSVGTSVAHEGPCS